MRGRLRRVNASEPLMTPRYSSLRIVPTLRTWLNRAADAGGGPGTAHPSEYAVVPDPAVVEEISGRSLTSTESLAEVWLALRATATWTKGATRLHTEGREGGDGLGRRVVGGVRVEMLLPVAHQIPSSDRRSRLRKSSKAAT